MHQVQFSSMRLTLFVVSEAAIVSTRPVEELNLNYSFKWTVWRFSYYARNFVYQNNWKI